MKSFVFFMAVALATTFPNIKSQAGGTISTKKTYEDPYVKICSVFIGNPSKNKVKPLLEAVMSRYKLAINNENIMKAASCLLTLRKTSKIGITEMKILTHMYLYGVKNSTFPNQAALSSVILEKL